VFAISSRYAGRNENSVLVGYRRGATRSPFWLLTPDFLDSHIPQGYQGEALASWTPQNKVSATFEHPPLNPTKPAGQK
jgi:hypothetical protein